MGNCFTCDHAIYIGYGNYSCNLDLTSLVIENYGDPAEDFMYCEGKDWEE